MALSISDIKFRKPKVVSDTVSNGGVAGSAEVLNGVRHSLFPRVTKTERTNGVTRYRKQFWSNENALNETAHDVMLWLEHPSNGGDRFYLGASTQSQVQSEFISSNPALVGSGFLSPGVSGGATSVSLMMEADDFVFPNGANLHISNKFLTAQTISASAVPGDSVVLSGTTWEKITATNDIEYPNGLVVDENTVMTYHGTANEEWAQIAENLTVDEQIANPSGGVTSPALTSLANITNGVSPFEGYRPVITTSASGTPLTAYVSATGVCSGDCSGGQLNMETGAWTTPINWSSYPNAPILATYSDIPYTYSGTTVTVALENPILNAYPATSTIAGACIHQEEVLASFSAGSVTSSLGTVDPVGGAPATNNLGTVSDTFTVVFTSSTAFTVSGVNSGSLSSGSVNFAYAPTNSNGHPYFSIPVAFWGGTWAIGDTFVFTTTPAKLPMFLKEIVPAGTTQEPNNLVVLGWYTE